METHRRFHAPGYVVQFYERDEELVETVTEYLAEGLRADDLVIVVATDAHLSDFAHALGARGADVAGSVADGSLVTIEVTSALSAVMSSGSPDSAAFEDLIGSLVRRAAECGRGVRAYGELVAQLWDAGQVNAAIEMESLWNSLGLQIPFSVFCAYPTRLVAEATPRNELGRVYELGGAIAGRSDSAAAPFEIAPTRHFAKGTQAPRAARCFVVETLQQWGREELIDDAAIAVTELATNAVIHARSDFDVAMSLLDGGVRIAVSDGSRMLPVLHDPSLHAPSGRGVAVVAALADRWGIELGPTPGKTVWVVLR